MHTPQTPLSSNDRGLRVIGRRFTAAAVIIPFALSSSVSMAQPMAVPSSVAESSGSSRRIQSIGPTAMPASTITSSTLLAPGVGPAQTPSAQARGLAQLPLGLSRIAGSNAPRFGSQLFTGAFSAPGLGDGSAQTIAPGDRIEVRIVGAAKVDSTATVDSQGRIFVPEIGVVQVAGASARDLSHRIQVKAAETFSGSLEIYAQPLGAQGIGVYVTGAVARPGMYPGSPGESALHYIDRAGGVDAERGSYRDVTIMRGGKAIQRLDLYVFLLQGGLPPHVLQRGDTIVVGSVGPLIEVTTPDGSRMRYELIRGRETGAALLELVRPNPALTRALVTGLREGSGRSFGVDMSTLLTMPLASGDKVELAEDAQVETIRIAIEGAHIGRAVLALPRGASLGQALDRMEIDTVTANINAIQIRRRSVADSQKRAIEGALARLHESIFNARSITPGEAEIRQKEADLVERFIERARRVEPRGIIVVAGSTARETVPLEDGDIIIVPAISGVVVIHGEVMAPGAFAHRPGASASDYLNLAGGPSRNANTGDLLVAKADGRVLKAGETRVEPGDEVIVMPEAPSGLYALGRDLVAALFQIAVTARTIIKL